MREANDILEHDESRLEEVDEQSQLLKKVVALVVLVHGAVRTDRGEALAGRAREDDVQVARPEARLFRELSESHTPNVVTNDFGVRVVRSERCCAYFAYVDTKQDLELACLSEAVRKAA